MNELQRVRVFSAQARRVVVLVVSSVILCSATGCAGTKEESKAANRWASLPRTMGCVVEDADQLQDVPPALRVQQVTLRHEGGQLLVISLQFSQIAPPDPEVVNGPYGPRNATGSMGTSILVIPAGSHDERPYLVIDSPQPAIQSGWKAEIVAGQTHANAMQSSSVSGDTRTLVVDLGDQADVFGSGQMSADVDVMLSVDGTSPETDTLLKVQKCSWDHPVNPSSSAAGTTPKQRASQRSRAPSASAVAPAAPSGQSATEQVVDAAKVGDCIRRVLGAPQLDGSVSVKVQAQDCSSPGATDYVIDIQYTARPTCSEWVRIRPQTSPKVLCLQKVS